MDDVISRQVAIDAVGSMLRRKFGIGGDLAEITLSGMPSADAVPVVRCKDCKYYEETNSRIGTCLLTISGAEVDGYCAWGERRTDATD